MIFGIGAGFVKVYPLGAVKWQVFANFLADLKEDHEAAIDIFLIKLALWQLRFDE